MAIPRESNVIIWGDDALFKFQLLLPFLKIKGVRIILRENQIYFYKEIYFGVGVIHNYLLPILYHYVDDIIVQSEIVELFYKRRFPFISEVYFVPNFLDLDFARACRANLNQLNKSNIKILFIGQFSKFKGYENLKILLDKVNRPLIIKINSKTVVPNKFFLEFTKHEYCISIGYQDKLELYNGIDIYVNLSLAEGMSNSILDALVANKVVLTLYNSSSLVYLKKHFRNLYIFNNMSELVYFLDKFDLTKTFTTDISNLENYNKSVNQKWSKILNNQRLI
jgi:hypothetical protein